MQLEASRKTSALLRLAAVIALGAAAFAFLLPDQRPATRAAGVPPLEILPETGGDPREPLPLGCRLHVETEPAGASLLVNGQLIGPTPRTLDGLSKGVYGLRLERDGCKPVSRTVEIGESGAIVREKLAALPTGSITVDIEPKGAEVLLDGELIGHTPLKVEHVSAGCYELLIRKTNFEPYSRRIAVEPGEPLVYSGFELKDKILAMLEGLVKTEPQRVAHYIDLGHYHFINDRMDESVDVFTQGMEVLQAPLDFDGPGYGGKQHMSAAEIMLEQRLRKEDEGRFLKEKDKHRNWPRRDTKAFRKKMDEAEEIVSRRNVASWLWADRAGRAHIKNRNFTRAATIYLDHIAAAPDSPDLPRAQVALMEVYLMQRNLLKTNEIFVAFMTHNAGNPAMLQLCGSSIAVYQDRMLSKEHREQVLEMAERSLLKAMALRMPAPQKAQCLFDLGKVNLYQSRPADAVTALENSVLQTTDLASKDERSLTLGEALRKAGRLSEARNVYERLETSGRTTEVREGAKTGLLYVAADEVKKK